MTVDEIVLAVNHALTGCPSVLPAPTPAAPAPTAAPSPTAGEEFVVQASDFECLLNWPQVRHFRITNKLGRLQEALALAQAAADTPGLRFPPGMIIQLIPMEAMVKRGGDFEPEHHGWEYLTLQVGARGTVITSRGGIESNDGRCYGCHVAARPFDYVCENNHGCVPLNLTQEIVDQLQRLDPRCR